MGGEESEDSKPKDPLTLKIALSGLKKKSLGQAVFRAFLKQQVFFTIDFITFTLYLRYDWLELKTLNFLQ